MKKFVSSLLVFFIFHLHLMAQDYRDLDSLKVELQKYIDSKIELGNSAISLRDTTQVKILFELSKVHWYNDFEKAIDYANQSINLAQNINYKKGVVDGNYCLSMIYMNTGDDSLALNYTNKTLALAIATNYKERIADAYVNFCFIYMLFSKYDKSLDFGIKGLKFAESINYRECIAMAYCNLGSVSYALGNFEKALQSYSTSLQIANSIGYTIEVSAATANIGLIYASKGDYSKAHFFVNRALKINQEIGNILWEAYNLDLIGVAYESTGNYKESLRCSLKSAKILRRLGEKVKLCTTLSNIGWMYISVGEYVNARASLNESIEIAKEENYIDGFWSAYEGLVKLDTVEGKWKLALEDHLKFVAYRDSANNKENLKKAIESAMNYDFEKKQISDSLKFLQEKTIAEIKLQKQKTYTYGGLIVILTTIVLLFLVYKNYKKQQTANRMLKEAQEQLIRSEKLAAFGVMASRVAHEIQNPLNFVNNFSEISKEIVTELISATDENEKKETSEILIDNLQRINEHGRRAADIVKQLQEHTLKGTAHEFFETDGK
ncbi:MAG: tetratricopeptide repeat protein [Bacteroidetes bacterium]|nr:tetratricopeptide repeat protein [Bacteroidota bacterium]